MGLAIAPVYANGIIGTDRLRNESTQITKERISSENFDIEFTVLSYDVGAEKPDPRIFATAETLVKESILTEDERQYTMEKLYIGDEYENDGSAAINAGWNSLLVDRDAKFEDKFPQTVQKQNGLTIERVAQLWPPESHILRNIVGIHQN
jgi:hypothetical protein